MNTSHVSIKCEIVVEHPKTNFTTEQVYTADSVVEEGNYHRAVREAATKLLKMIREEGLEQPTASEQMPPVNVAGDECREKAALREQFPAFHA